MDLNNIVNKLRGEIESLNTATTVNTILLTEVAEQFDSYTQDKVSLEDLKNTSKKGSSVNTATPIKLGNTKYNPVYLVFFFTFSFFNLSTFTFLICFNLLTFNASILL